VIEQEIASQTPLKRVKKDRDALSPNIGISKAPEII